MPTRTSPTRNRTASDRAGTTTTISRPEQEVLRRCADLCNETVTYCLEQGGEHVEAEHVRCLIDTAELCTATANSIARGSEHSDDLMEICAEVCVCTQESCEAFEDDEQMEACAQACKEAAEFCKG